MNKSGVLGTGSNIDMREVFFNVSGDFGTISVGRTLALFQRQAILKDLTLFGMGAAVRIPMAAAPAWVVSALVMSIPTSGPGLSTRHRI